ncbi:natural killer cells antigen CD94-like [Bufo bufo]|uniref:natural killer cells antigen CD94-like n=1 Tax=Bufo bufo TaxID=8384 RepID=UPI001ABE87BA|nr:natural killer cells antigen CD94-like [Bufo bufo]XP_040292483.1 natural killer cells antigen CD94-like [Bufo bufo]
MELQTEYAILKLPLDSNHSQLDIANRKEAFEISVTDTRPEQIKTKQSNVWNGTIIVFLLILIIILSCTIGVLVYQMQSYFENKKNGTRSTWDAEFKDKCSLSYLRAELCIKNPNTTNDQENECKLCPANWKLFQENCYLIYNNTQIKSWNDSQTYCIGMKSHLLVIENKEQMAFLDQIVYRDASYWIGLYFDNNIRNWTWVNCETCKDFQLNFKNTRPGDNHCVLKSSRYNSEKCNSQQSWICQRKASKL